jgi:hypothetical protein
MEKQSSLLLALTVIDRYRLFIISVDILDQYERKLVAEADAIFYSSNVFFFFFC